MTPKELSWEADAYVERERTRRQERKVLAWLVAGLSRSKRLPDLAVFLEEQPANEVPRKQSWQEMKAFMRQVATVQNAHG